MECGEKSVFFHECNAQVKILIFSPHGMKYTLFGIHKKIFFLFILHKELQKAKRNLFPARFSSNLTVAVCLLV